MLINNINIMFSLNFCVGFFELIQTIRYRMVCGNGFSDQHDEVNFATPPFYKTNNRKQGWEEGRNHIDTRKGCKA